MWQFILTEGVLLLGLPATYLFVQYRQLPIQRLFLVSSWLLVAHLILTFAAYFFGTSFRLAFFNVAWILLGYAALCLTFISNLRLPSNKLRFFVRILTAIPLVLIYLLATLGFFILILAMAEIAESPIYADFHAPNLMCEVGRVRTIAARHGQTGRLYATSAFMPLLKREVASIHVSWLNRFPPDHVSRTYPGDYSVPTRGEDFCSQLFQGYLNSRQ